tara:strand:- start:177 stop:359 length:183 start_codon:yes stop_codon:yes gene_type:complete
MYFTPMEVLAEPLLVDEVTGTFRLIGESVASAFAQPDKHPPTVKPPELALDAAVLERRRL